MRAIWKGHINFALVSIPVAVVSGSKTSDISLKYLHREDLSPVSYKRFCAAEDREVPWDEITRGYEFEKGRFVEITQEELGSANAALTRAIRIVQFVDLSEIDPVYFDKPYYLAPQPGGEHAYQLLAEALNRSGQAGIAKVVLKTREHLAAIRPSGRLMSMQTLRFAHEIVDPATVELPEAVELESQELELAHTLIETMRGEFEPSGYTDEYRSQVLEVIRQKVAGVPPGPSGGTAPAPGKVVDLMEVLRKSVEGTKKSKRTLPRREKTVAVASRKGKKSRSRSRA